MIYLIVGHRGTGKTLWLKKLKQIFINSQYKKEKQPLFFDLDTEIINSRPSGLSTVQHLSGGHLPSNWRALEQKKIRELLNRYKDCPVDVFISVGAGFKWHNFCNPLGETLPTSGLSKGHKKGLSGYKNCLVIFLIRETDAYGRVFLDRPRLLNKGLSKVKSPYEEYMSLYFNREKTYQQIKTESFVLPEQDFTFSETEKLFFSLYIPQQPGQQGRGIITLNKYSLPGDVAKWPYFIQKRLAWGVLFELKEGQLSQKKQALLQKLIPTESQLWSYAPFLKKLRQAGPPVFTSKKAKPLCIYDWPLERGLDSLHTPPPVLSLHAREHGESVSSLGAKLVRNRAGHFKLAVPVYNFSDLLQGHLWFLEDKQNRSFLPCSVRGETLDLKMPSSVLPCSAPVTLEKKSEGVAVAKHNTLMGRWRWYRCLFGPSMKLHFIREAHSMVLDQPFLYEYLYNQQACSSSLDSRGEGRHNALVRDDNRHKVRLNATTNDDSRGDSPPAVGGWGAVLGDPVAHSASPAFHRAFFGRFVKIPLGEEELTKQNLLILQKMGMVFAAVTSPLKKKAFYVCDSPDKLASSFKSVNTLILQGTKWLGCNTDLAGLRTLLTKAYQKYQLILDQAGEAMPSLGEAKLLHSPHLKADSSSPISITGQNQEQKPFGCMQSLIAVWGGGGVKKLIQQELPLACFYSARRQSLCPVSHVVRRGWTNQQSYGAGSPQSEQSECAFTGQEQPLVSIVIWAVGRSRAFRFPPTRWKPRLVIDLNYTKDSPGLEYALGCRAEYISGKAMFEGQAQQQQKLFQMLAH